MKDDISDEELVALALSRGIAIDNPNKQDKSSGIGYLLNAAKMIPGSDYLKTIDPIASMGNRVNTAIQGGLETAAEKMGRVGVPPALAAGMATVPATLSEAMIPKDRLGVLMTAAGLGIGRMAKGAKLATDARAAGKAPVLKPGPLQMAGASVMTTESAIPTKYSGAIVADPSILSDATPGIKEVRQMYDAYFKSKKMSFDPELYQEVFGKRYSPREGQLTKLENVVQETIENIGGKAPPKTEQLVLAKQAASKLQESESAMRNANLMRQYARDEKLLSDEIAKTGDTTLQELDRMYFRANAKEAAGSLFPKNKNMSPNALRSYLMLHNFTNAGQRLLEGNLGQAAWSAGRGAVMSPYVAARAFSAQASPLSKALMLNMGGNIPGNIGR